MARTWPTHLENLALSSDAASSAAEGSSTEAPGVNSGAAQRSFGNPQAPAISVASVWKMESPAAADAALSGQNDHFIYRRDGHPNERSLASKLAQLHSGSQAVITAQGMSAIAAVAMTTLRPNRPVWIAHELYGKSSKLFASNLSNWGAIVHTFDPTNANDVAALASAKADLVLVETISNPTMAVPDLRSVIAAAHNAGAQVMVDNTFATHLLCRPLELGADMVVESLSKIVCGHSDSMLGSIVVSDRELGRRLQDTVSTFGMASSPLDCYLTERGLMTLALRMERVLQNALALAELLEQLRIPSGDQSQHEGGSLVRRVDFPGLASHPQHTIAQQQFSGAFGWMLSFQLNTERMSVEQFFGRALPEIAFVPSLGDVCTTLSHPRSTSHRSLTAEQLAKLGISDSTIRISCGIEPTDWLVSKFSRILASHHARTSAGQ